MSTRIDSEKATSLERFEPPYELAKSCMIGKQYCISSCILNWINLFKRAIQKSKLFYNDIKHAIQKGKLSYSNIAEGGKIVQKLRRAK